MPPYALSDVIASYRWLGHQGQGFTELNALSPEYLPGRENVERNTRHNAFPVIAYASSEQEVVRFVEQHHANRMLSYGLNPRPRKFESANGRPRSAKEKEVEVVQSLLLDVDVNSPLPSQEHIAALADFLNRADSFFLDLCLLPPVKTYTGRGYHLLCAFPKIEVKGCADIGTRLKLFAGQFRTAYQHELADLDAKVDNTADARRVVRVGGTAKPQVGIISKFYGSERLEDERLRAYLLGPLTQATQDPQRKVALRSSAQLRPAADIPLWFAGLLAADSPTGRLWSGTGKTAGDTSPSGYDFSLMCRLIRLGHTDLDDLATILALRPKGSVITRGRDDRYIRRTVGNALLLQSPRTDRQTA